MSLIDFYPDFEISDNYRGITLEKQPLIYQSLVKLKQMD